MFQPLNNEETAFIFLNQRQLVETLYQLYQRIDLNHALLEQSYQIVQQHKFMPKPVTPKAKPTKKRTSKKAGK